MHSMRELYRVGELHHEPIPVHTISLAPLDEQPRYQRYRGGSLRVVVNVLGGEGTRPVPASNGAAVFVVISSLLGLPEWVCNTTFCCQADLRVSTEQATLLEHIVGEEHPVGSKLTGNQRRL